MKKLVMMAAIACLGLAAQAAFTVNWSANDVYDWDDYEYWGPAKLYLTLTTADGENLTVQQSATMMDGAISVAQFQVYSTDIGTALDTASYSAYYEMVMAGVPVENGFRTYTFKSDTLTGTVAGSGSTLDLNFGSSGNWTSSGAVPEPTSGVLLLVGLAGLALKRKRA